MISFKEAQNIVLSRKDNLGTEQIHFHNAIGRILAEDIFSDVDFPPFNKAAMDGYAIKEDDIDNELDIIEVIAAGQAPKNKIKNGQAAKIMTGAPVPEGADFVIQVELSETVADNKVKFTGKSTNNIIAKASETKKGDKVLQKGDKIDARHIAILASVGKTKVWTYKQPVVGIITTGDEIIEPGNIPQEAQIRNSNGHQLIGQITECGIIPKYYGIVPDDFKSIKNLLNQGIKECDVLIASGGVSMGDFDFVSKALIDFGANILFSKIAVKPGKPTTYSVFRNTYIFGMPGNPVASFIQFEMFAKPLLFQLMGHKYTPRITRLELAEDYSRKKTERQAHLPVKIIDNKVYLSKYKGSSHIHALSTSDGLITIEKDKSRIKKGTYIDVRLF